GWVGWAWGRTGRPLGRTAVGLTLHHSIHPSILFAQCSWRTTRRVWGGVGREIFEKSEPRPKARELCLLRTSRPFLCPSRPRRFSPRVRSEEFEGGVWDGESP